MISVDCGDLQQPVLCAQLSHKLNQIFCQSHTFCWPVESPRVGRHQWETLSWKSVAFTKPNADFGYDCRLINAIRNNKQAVAVAVAG